MANYMLSLLGAMDRLWFHQIILLSQPTNSLISNKNHESTSPPHEDQYVSDSFTSPSSSLFLSPLDDDDDDDQDQDQKNSSESPASTNLQDDSNYEEDEEEDEEDNEDEENSNQKQQKTRRNILATSLNRSNSTSPSSSAEKLSISKASTRRRSLVLQKSMSCRSLGDLELEEVKGFMDLGFIFKKENMSPRMMSLLPGLQRLGGKLNHKNKAEKAATHEVEEEEDEESKSRPYLSEAWLIKKPNSPLLNLRVPKLSAASEMKRHLRFWARTVASEIQ